MEKNNRQEGRKKKKKHKTQKPQGGLEGSGLAGWRITKKTQTLVPINELHKLQLKPWALI